MANATIDQEERRNALSEARSNSQMPNAQPSHPGDLHVPHDEENNNNDMAGRKNNSHGSRLEAARKGGVVETAKVAKDLAAVATPMGALSLLKQVDFIGDMPYVAALGAALLKDLLDFVLAETVILPIIFSALCTIFIFMMMLLVGANGKKKGASKWISKIGLLSVGGIADSIPAIDFMPIETITVAMVYVMELIERKGASKK